MNFRDRYASCFEYEDPEEVQGIENNSMFSDPNAGDYPSSNRA